MFSDLTLIPLYVIIQPYEKSQVKHLDNTFEDIFPYEQDMILNSGRCFFTGHRRISKQTADKLLPRLKAAVSYLLSKGVTEFHTGGAIGFDTFAAMMIIDLKRYHPEIRLILDLPFLNQSDLWDEKNKRLYNFILEHADKTNYAHTGTVKDANEIKKYLLERNRMMADSCYYCIAYFSGARGGTNYTVSYAKNAGCEIINLYYDTEFTK